MGTDRNEPTAAVRERVLAARAIAADRGVEHERRHPGRPPRRARAARTPTRADVLAQALKSGRLSARGLHRVRRVARTVADLQDATERVVTAAHVAIALSLRADAAPARPTTGPSRHDRRPRRSASRSCSPATRPWARGGSPSCSTSAAPRRAGPRWAATRPPTRMRALAAPRRAGIATLLPSASWLPRPAATRSRTPRRAVRPGRPRRARPTSGRDRRHPPVHRGRRRVRPRARPRAHRGGRGGGVRPRARHRRRRPPRRARGGRAPGRRGGQRARRRVPVQAPRPVAPRRARPACCSARHPSARGPRRGGSPPATGSSRRCAPRGRGRVARRRRLDAHRQGGGRPRHPGDGRPWLGAEPVRRRAPTS